LKEVEHEDATTGWVAMIQGALLIKMLEIAIALEEESSSKKPPAKKAKIEKTDDDTRS